MVSKQAVQVEMVKVKIGVTWAATERIRLRLEYYYK